MDSGRLRALVVLLAGVPGVAAADTAMPARTPGTESGFSLFQAHCTGCHGNPDVERAPSPEALRAMTPDRIYAALAPAGPMARQAAALNDGERRSIAEFMGGRPLGSAAAGTMRAITNPCRRATTAPGPLAKASWNGWSPDDANHRFQPASAAGLSPADVPRLRLKWAFGYPSAVSSNTQPTVVDGRIYVGSDNGFVYALDAGTGCVHWAYETGSIVRGVAVVGRAGRGRQAVYFGDGHARVHAVDARTGKRLWQTQVDEHFVARITAGPHLASGVLYVPVSSSEEYGAGVPEYPCCTSRGSVVALDARTGRRLWKAWVVPDEPRPYHRQANGVWLYRPAGGAVWNTPTLDPVRHAIYFGTGDATTAPSPPTTDAVMAVDASSGALLWSVQATADDVHLGACSGARHSEACPEVNGPDMDIGNSPILVTLGSGRRALLFGTKAADVLAVDPDDGGRLLYRVNAAGADAGGVYRPGAPAIMWGGAADAERVYYGLGTGGVAALDPATGRVLWRVRPGEGGVGDYFGAAPTVVPGVVFAGSGRGVLYALSADDGRELWHYDTARSLPTVNGVDAHGGSISASGAVAVGGMLFVGSGYAIGNGLSAGNLLLAFEVGPPEGANHP